MIHILTLNWNGKPLLEKLRNSLRISVPFMWHIRDNGSKDMTEEEMNSWNSDYTRFYQIGHNRDSFSTGMNWLFNKADPKDDDYILLLNNDVEFCDASALNKMLNIIKKDNEVGVVGGRLLYNGTDRLQHAGIIFGPKYNNLPFHYKRGDRTNEYVEKNREFQAVTAACAITRASLWKELGGLSAKFKWAFDDVDYCLRVKQLNKKIVYCGDVKIYHEESISLKKNPVNVMFISDNVKAFKEIWEGKYDIDHEKYLKDKNYMLYEY